MIDGKSHDQVFSHTTEFPAWTDPDISSPFTSQILANKQPFPPPPSPERASGLTVCTVYVHKTDSPIPAHALLAQAETIAPFCPSRAIPSFPVVYPSPAEGDGIVVSGKGGNVGEGKGREDEKGVETRQSMQVPSSTRCILGVCSQRRGRSGSP